jgi:prefoldin subunit 5
MKGSSAAFAQLLQIRNMRADNLARELSELQRHLKHLEKARQDIEAQLRETQTRADAALFEVLQPGRRVDGKQLQCAAAIETTLRARVADLRRQRDELDRERAAVEIEIARCASNLRRARQTALRTELVLDEIDRDPPR